MTIPDDIQAAADEVLKKIEFVAGWNPVEQREIIARALMVERDRWQPIETAPKNGTHILVFCEGAGQSVAWWEAKFDAEGGDFNEHDEYVSQYRAAWTDGTVVSFSYEELAELHPTHWQPLPAPPAIRGGTNDR